FSQNTVQSCLGQPPVVVHGGSPFGRPLADAAYIAGAATLRQCFGRSWLSGCRRTAAGGTAGHAIPSGAARPRPRISHRYGPGAWHSGTDGVRSGEEQQNMSIDAPQGRSGPVLGSLTEHTSLRSRVTEVLREAM